MSDVIIRYRLNPTIACILSRPKETNSPVFLTSESPNDAINDIFQRQFDENWRAIVEQVAVLLNGFHSSVHRIFTTGLFCVAITDTVQLSLVIKKKIELRSIKKRFIIDD